MTFRATDIDPLSDLEKSFTHCNPDPQSRPPVVGKIEQLTEKGTRHMNTNEKVNVEDRSITTVSRRLDRIEKLLVSIFRSGTVRRTMTEDEEQLYHDLYEECEDRGLIEKEY